MELFTKFNSKVNNFSSHSHGLVSSQLKLTRRLIFVSWLRVSYFCAKVNSKVNFFSFHSCRLLSSLLKLTKKLKKSFHS